MSPSQLKALSYGLQQSFLTCKTSDEVFSFLRDLCTEAEIIELSQRLDIAARLAKGQSYKKIEEDTTASSTTIARVAKFLHGKEKGYLTVFGRIAR